MEDRDWSDLIFSVRLSRRYHMHFQEAYTRWNTLSSFLTALSGSATLAAALDEAAILPWLAATTAVVGAIDLVLRTTAKAVFHRDLAQEFTNLEKDLVLAERNKTSIKTFVSRRLEIETKEPPPHQTITDLCYNEEARARGNEEKHFAEVPVRRRLVVCLFSLRTDFLRT